VIERNCKVISNALGIRIEKKDILKKEPFLYNNSELMTQSSKLVTFIVGASKPNKIYPKEKFLELAQRLNEKVLVVWGNEEEYQTALWLSEQSDLITLDEKGSLEDLKFKIQNSKLVIGGDTGPTHIAWAVNTPSITIFGNTPEYRNTYITPINKVIKSESFVDPLNLDKSDFSIEEIKAVKIADMAKGLLR
jgi:heptosyltransferase-1